MSPPRIRKRSTSSVTPSWSSSQKRKVTNKDIPDELSPRALLSTQRRKRGSVFDASSFSLIQLKRFQTGDLARFFQLDFTFCNQKILNKLLPVGDLFYIPIPPTYRSSSNSITDFQRLPKNYRTRAVEFETDLLKEIEDDIVAKEEMKKSCPDITLEF
mmetsp:Transcript_44178/g.86693  ORF Transcript_44178/g.86693 Transcript_44178/m.86693 type:complete len:158 (+) Transcript_44178:460-933(+)